jgi:hypothetical protein
MPNFDPMDFIEFDNANEGMGRVGYHVYKGAIDAGASLTEAAIVVAGYFTGFLRVSVMRGEEGESEGNDEV